MSMMNQRRNNTFMMMVMGVGTHQTPLCGFLQLYSNTGKMVKNHQSTRDFGTIRLIHGVFAQNCDPASCAGTFF